MPESAPTYYLDLVSLHEHLNRSGDREVAITAAAYCETYLADILKSKMPGLDHKLGKKIFGSGGALGPASARYDMARALNIVIPATHKDLGRIATIRNRFAHNIAVDSFDHNMVRDLVDKLDGEAIEISKDAPPFESLSRREKFVLRTSDICIKLHNAVNVIQQKQGAEYMSQSQYTISSVGYRLG